MPRQVMWVAILTAMSLGLPGVAKADSQNLQLGCVSITCATGGSIITTATLAAGDVLSVTGNSTTDGEFFLAVYIPVGTSGGNFNSTNGSSAEIWDFGVLSSPTDNDTGGNDHNYGSSVSMESLAGTAATAFNVFDIDTGLVLSCPQGPPCTTDFTLPAGSYPLGTILVGFVEDSNRNVIADTPWSESLIAIPEPSTLGMLGFGLLTFVGIAQRKLSA